jgi:hypothetical protein
VHRKLHAGCALLQDGKWSQVPFVVPIRTGIVMLEGNARSSGGQEIITLMSHAEIALRVKLLGRFSFRISWYQGIEGFTGWHGGNDSDLPWNNSPRTEVKHSSWSGSREYAAAADFAAMIANVTNHLADEHQLPNGGYGYLGVCNDSVATIQAAMNEPVTMFPCILAGQAKIQVLKAYDVRFEDLCAALHTGAAHGHQTVWLCTGSMCDQSAGLHFVSSGLAHH